MAGWVAVAAAVVGVAALCQSAVAHDYRSRDMDIIHPWTRPTAAGADVAEVYLTAINRSTTPDRLLGGRTSVAQQVRVATRDEPQGPRSARASAIDVAFARPLDLGPGSAYVRLSGLRRPLARGDSFALTLVFARAGAIDVTVVVQETPDH